MCRKLVRPVSRTWPRFCEELKLSNFHSLEKQGWKKKCIPFVALIRE